MDRLTLKAEKRKVFGRKVKNLRREGILPANVYGKKVKSEAVQVSITEFQKVFRQVGETGLVELAINKEKKPVLIHNVQKDPVADAPIHADFLQVDLKQKVVAKIPMELTGESPAEKQGLGTIVQYVSEVEVEALPTDLPEKFEIDLTPLINVDDAILIKALSVDIKKVEIKNDPEQIIVKVEPLRKEEEILPPPAPEAAPEALSEERIPTEGEQPQEVAEKPQEKNP